MKKKEPKAKSSGATLKVVGPSNGGRPKRVGNSDDVDFESVRELARIAAEFDLAEVEADGSGHVRVRRGGGGPVEAAPALSGPRSIALTPAAAAPEAPVFVDVGQPVRKGQVVCIVEAMKLMNEIEAESEGRIEEILVQNGEHVEYGQNLVRLSK